MIFCKFLSRLAALVQSEYLDISAICGHELLIDVGPSLPDVALWRIHTAATPYL